MIDCPQCRSMRIKVRELQEEIEEWRRQEKEHREDAETSRRIAAARRCFRIGKGEARLLLALMAAAPRVLTRQDIFDTLGSPGRDADMKVVDVTVSRLRRNLRMEGYPDAITSERGVGYALRLDLAPALRREIEVALPPNENGLPARGWVA